MSSVESERLLLHYRINTQLGRNVYAGWARLESKLGDEAGATEASARASEVINLIASNVKDEKLRTTFLNATRKQL